MMEKWSVFRGQVWKIDQRWSASQLFVHAERLKGEGEWAPLSNAAPTKIILIDECVACLAGCVVAESWERDAWPPETWDPLPRELWKEKLQAAREREGAVLLMHYLLPHVRMYQKLRVLKISERAFYYRLNSALDTLEREYQYQIEDSENVQ